jgi:hypothetical protein
MNRPGSGGGYTFTNQARRLTDDMAVVFHHEGWDVHRAEIQFTDPRYIARFSTFPFKHAMFDILRMCWPQLRRKTGEIRIPAEAEGEYDLVCIGSPTWWLTTCMPIRSFLKSDAAGRLLERRKVATYVVCRRYWGNNLKSVERLAREKGAEPVGAIDFVFAGRQIRSFLALVSYFGSGQTRERYLGIKIPPSNLQPGAAGEARHFAARLAAREPVADLTPLGAVVATASIGVLCTGGISASQVSRRLVR